MSGFRLAVASGQQLVAVAGLSQEYLALRGMHVAASASSVACCMLAYLLLPLPLVLEAAYWLGGCMTWRSHTFATRNRPSSFFVFANWVILGHRLGATCHMCTVWKLGVFCCLGASAGLLS